MFLESAALASVTTMKVEKEEEASKYK